MSFDLSFIKPSGSSPTLDELRTARSYKGLASPEEQQTIRQLAEDLVAAYEGARWGEARGNLANGAFVTDGPLPDIDLRPRSLFISSRPDPNNPEHLALFKGLLAFLEQRGYVCFDHQRGEFLDSATFSFG